MNPLEKLNAAAARLIQDADSCRDRSLSIRLKETAATIRGAVLTIRTALEGPAIPAAKRRRFDLIVGDEGGGA
ncbi:MAG TPA: hypothetical protein PLI96_11335 [Halothiobacillus sp.]|nr:hypothetical protein [Halothiobacillus sp.]